MSFRHKHSFHAFHLIFSNASLIFAVCSVDLCRLNGSSSTSETFNNPCLSHTQEFKIKDVELWGFVNASKYEEMLTICRTEKQGIWNL